MTPSREVSRQNRAYIVARLLNAVGILCLLFVAMVIVFNAVGAWL